MTRSGVLRPAGEVLAEFEALLDEVDPRRSGLDAAVRLEWVRAARRVRTRVEALAALLTAEADRANASQQAAGTQMSSWLGLGEPLSRREAAAAVGQARALVEHPLVGEAAVGGRIGTGQARAIGRVLDGLAPQLNPGQQSAAEQVMIDLARHLDADQLARSSGQVLAQVVPPDAGESEEVRLQREVEAARRARSLRVYREGALVRFEGCLPRVEGERFVSLLSAHAESVRRTALEARDPLSESTTTEQRKADAFIALLGSVEKAKPVSGVGGAKVIVKLDYHQLRRDAAGAGLIGEDQEVSAGELRQLCCDAELVSAVLGGPGEVLDVGRSSRLVTAPIRTALILRDGGCTFPGCDVRPELCEAHHIRPWWDGGDTALSNLVLLCHHHHGLVEPAKYGLRDQWSVQLRANGLPEFIPPARFDPARRPLQNQRTKAKSGSPPGVIARMTPGAGGGVPPGAERGVVTGAEWGVATGAEWGVATGAERGAQPVEAVETVGARVGDGRLAALGG